MGEERPDVGTKELSRAEWAELARLIEDWRVLERTGRPADTDESAAPHPQYWALVERQVSGETCSAT
jgi:hypothetical protein